MKPVFAMIVLSAAALSVSVAEAVTYKVDESVPCSAFGCTGNLNAIGTFEFDTLGTFTDGDAETQISDFEITISSPRNQPTILTPANASVTVLGTITATPTAASVEFVGGAPGDSHSRQRSAFSFSWSCPLPSISRPERTFISNAPNGEFEQGTTFGSLANLSFPSANGNNPTPIPLPATLPLVLGSLAVLVWLAPDALEAIRPLTVRTVLPRTGGPAGLSVFPGRRL
jgi:hypothetical protein